MQKCALAIHDLSCIGRSSLTVALPVLSAAGINTGVIPTALLSTQTGGFTGYTHMDLSGELLPIARHFATLGLHFDAIYTGYLANGEQCVMVEQIIKLLRDEHTHVLVDPAFGDGGKLYSLLPSAMPQAMGALCRHAHTIVPNITEAALMLGLPYPEQVTRKDVVKMCFALREWGIRNVMITDVRPNPDTIGIACLGAGMEEPVFLLREMCKGLFHGAGDTFASFLLGGILRELPLPRACTLALDMTEGSIRQTIRNGRDTRFGLCFEPLLGEYIRRLEKESGEAAGSDAPINY